MREFDRETVRKIWQRVQSDSPVSGTVGDCCSLSECIAWELTFGDLYRRIAGKVPGNMANTLRQLARQEQNHAQLLKGICVMTEGISPPIHPIPVQRAPVSVLLRQCYGEKLRAISQYEKRTDDGRFGEVFQRILQQEQAQCHFLLRLMGTVKP